MYPETPTSIPEGDVSGKTVRDSWTVPSLPIDTFLASGGRGPEPVFHGQHLDPAPPLLRKVLPPVDPPAAAGFPFSAQTPPLHHLFLSGQFLRFLGAGLDSPGPFLDERLASSRRLGSL